MYKGVKFPIQFGDLWREGLKNKNGRWATRVESDKAERFFWKQYIEKLPEHYKPPEHVRKLQSVILSFLLESDEVLEIGPGWGNYSFPIAEKVKNLTCVDLSKDILNYIDIQAKQRGIDNIQFIHKKWEEVSGLEPYDVVLGMNCFYRMKDIEKALLAMNQYAKRLCLAGVISGPERPHVIELVRKFGYSEKLVRRDYIHILNILYQLGIDANCQLVNIEKKYIYANEYELWKDNIGTLHVDDQDKPRILDLIKGYCYEDQGKWVYPHSCKAAIIYWEPVVFSGLPKMRTYSNISNY